MENNNWEESLKDILKDFTPEGVQPDWNAFSDYLNIHEKVTEWEENEAFDESIKEQFSETNQPIEVEGWDRIESSLNKADLQFDEHIRNKINHFEPTYDPKWSLILRRLSGVEFLRTKLIAFKVIEVAAVFLLLFTVVKMGQMGKLPFETPLFDKNEEKHRSFIPGMAEVIYDNNSSGSVSENSIASAENDHQVNELSNESAINQLNKISAVREENKYLNDITTDVPPGIKSMAVHQTENIDPRPYKNIKSVNGGVTNPLYALEVSTPDVDPLAEELDETSGRSFFKKLHVANFIKTVLSPIRWNGNRSLPKLAYVKQRPRTFTEFGIVSQLDYNKLQMPEDKLYNAGNQVVFPQEDLFSSSMGGGFTFALSHPRWAVESGMIYTSKSFKPGRGLKVGGIKDYSSVELKAIQLQLISIPLNFRYKFYNKGAFKMYGLTGTNITVIAQSDIDVPIKNHFPSLAPGENPNKHPKLQSTIRVSKAFREHFLDGAPFSTKSFLCVTAGAGFEYSVTENKTLFFQSALQYQLPNIKIFNNNGKNLRSLSFQAGIRTPLGQ